MLRYQRIQSDSEGIEKKQVLGEQVEEEPIMVFSSDTVIDPGAVMIIAFNAPVTNDAVP